MVTFRRFPTKAAAVWQALDEAGHVALVRRYFVDAGGWAEVRAERRGSAQGDPLYAVIGTRDTG